MVFQMLPDGPAARHPSVPTLPGPLSAAQRRAADRREPGAAVQLAGAGGVPVVAEGKGRGVFTLVLRGSTMVLYGFTMALRGSTMVLHGFTMGMTNIAIEIGRL